jgi:ribonuclease P protein component
VLPKRYRLTESADFRRVYEKGQSWSDRMIVLCKLPHDGPNSRFGFSVSRRIGNAVVRNHTKRLLREAIRLQCDLILPGWDVILIARKGIIGAEFVAVERSTTRLLGLARLLQVREERVEPTE